MTMTQASWRRLGWIVILGVVAGAIWYFLPRADSTTSVPLQSVSGRASSDTLQVVYGDCSREGDVLVEETTTTVTITVRLDWTSKLDCPDVSATEDVVLDENLGDRAIVDGSNSIVMDLQAP